jgi:hypothetical protein
MAMLVCCIDYPIRREDDVGIFEIERGMRVLFKLLSPYWHLSFVLPFADGDASKIYVSEQSNTQIPAHRNLSFQPCRLTYTGSLVLQRICPLEQGQPDPSEQREVAHSSTQIGT